MAEVVAILGRSGTGKSTSIRNLDPGTTFIFGAVNKMLPFKGGRKNYSSENKNIFYTADYKKIFTYLKKLSDKAGHIKTIIIDDSQYLMSDEFMKRASEKSFEKFTEIGKKYYDLIMFCKDLRPDLNIYFLSHTEENDQGTTKMKTIGKMLDDKVTLEGLFTVTLETYVENGKYKFLTQNNGRNTAKSPLEMFDSNMIDNDLVIVEEAIRSY